MFIAIPTDLRTFSHPWKGPAYIAAQRKANESKSTHVVCHVYSANPYTVVFSEQDFNKFPTGHHRRPFTRKMREEGKRVVIAKVIKRVQPEKSC